MRHKTFVRLAREYYAADRVAGEALLEYNIWLLEQMHAEVEHFGLYNTEEADEADYEESASPQR